MARTFSSQPLTPAGELRNLLADSEKLAVTIRGAGPDRVRELLIWLDRIADLFPELEAGGQNLQAERGRWETVQGAVRRHGPELLAELRPLGGLGALCAGLATPPPASNWWWRIDALLATQRQRRIRTTLTLIAGLLILIVGGYWLFNRLFPVDPIVVAVQQYRLDAEQALTRGDFASALNSYEAARAIAPNNPDVLAWLIVLADANNRPAEAAAALEQLQSLLPAPDLNAYLANAYIIANLPEKGLARAQQALAAQSDNVIALLAEGNAYIALGRPQEAIAALQAADAAAGAQGLTQHQVIARVRLADLLRMPIFPTPSPSATLRVSPAPP